MKLRLYTSSWHRYFGPGRVGISRGMPRGIAGGYKMYRALAPSADILSTCRDDQDTYRRRFFGEVLDRLDPQKVLDDLKTFSAPDGTVCLLCFENAPLHAHNWCHRTMVAEWLQRTAGVSVVEWSGLKESNPQQARLDV